MNRGFSAEFVFFLWSGARAVIMSSSNTSDVTAVPMKGFLLAVMLVHTCLIWNRMPVSLSDSYGLMMGQAGAADGIWRAAGDNWYENMPLVPTFGFLVFGWNLWPALGSVFTGRSLWNSMGRAMAVLVFLLVHRLSLVPNVAARKRSCGCGLFLGSVMSSFSIPW